MRRKLKLIICVAAILAVFGTAVPAAGAEPYGYDGFYITGYDVKAVIDEKNVYDVTETIAIHYTEPKHGIYRDIPVNREEKRRNPDGTEFTSKVSSRVWDVSVKGYEWSVESDSGWVSIKIGSAGYTVTGDQTYVISYKLGFGNDGSPDWDEVYFNIIGTDWPCTIDNVTFSVTLPNEFDKSKLGFSSGSYASAGYNIESLEYEVTGNMISGRVKDELWAYEGVTMRLELPDGYFDVPPLQLTEWILMGIMGVLLLVSFVLFLIYGRDKELVQTVEFYAPDGLTPAEVGYIIDGSVDNRDVVSLIVWWAHKGYLTITELGKNKYELTRLKDLPPGSKAFENQMFDGLFRNRTTVTTSDLQNKFYTTMETVKSLVKMAFAAPERTVYTKQSQKLMPRLTFFAALPFMLAIVLAFYRFGEMGLIFSLVMGVMVSVGLLIPTFNLIGLLRGWRGAEKPVLKLIIRLIFWVVLTGVMSLIVSGSAFEPLFVPAVVVSSILIGLCAVFIRKRTEKGNEWIGKIMGLRNFIEVAEKGRIVSLVMENPSYFYSVLPYAYVLGVTDMWIRNFEDIAIEPPSWYYGQGYFTPVYFGTSFTHAMSTMSSQMVSQPQSSGRSGGGGGFSGGGFSGGGGGGGGGHSW